MSTLFARAALALLALAAVPALAQSDYPNKPVRIMVGANAGGGTDVIARMLAEKFAESLKQPFVVENRPARRTRLLPTSPRRHPPTVIRCWLRPIPGRRSPRICSSSVSIR